MAAVAALDPAFTLYTGDVPAHDIWMVNQSSVLRDFNSTYAQLGALGLVYAALGNHDAAPVNLFPSDTIPASHRPQWAYDALSDDWTALMGANYSTPPTDGPEGSYSILHDDSPGGHPLRIISYNSVLYYKYNFYAYTDPMPADPDGLLAWLIDELTAAESAGQRVWLVAHIPAGGPDTLHAYSTAFDRIVNRYAATIAALFYGHTHTDLFQLSYRDYSADGRTAQSASAVAYIAPSLTPTSGPPAFRIYDIDPVTFAVLDYTVYIATLPAATAGTAGAPQIRWSKYYSAKEAYGGMVSPPVTAAADELTPAFWHNVTVAMERDDAVFRGFWERTTRGYNVSECTGACARKEICALRGGDARFNCRSGGWGVDLAKRERVEGAGGHEKGMKRPVCDDDGLGRVLGEMLRRPGVEKLIRQRAGLD
ncbi:acid sphingomyelinase and PHM5 phosphate metabolism protein [Aspergillus steynii IBT 23096]|uniref:Acid sphingomyelinase and PHM5 phosphate metabolism protein n=1 Tax=Aspergillus steynii IBT 23096 TaxID=1392250 RepID=A0A2I2GNB7_9EURO|nr:acid sphingomyelinase and PHM5 phosphate metabolism protein [Aspergillus steynii IBT 23096]PLB54382.1 acid sphingomyelinase and PHM5 phosphate metabolism protein [Aspergillus steynii IBT 23096]